MFVISIYFGTTLTAPHTLNDRNDCLVFLKLSSDNKLDIYMLTLTYGFIWKKWLVIEAENLCDIVKIWMLNCKTPERVIHPVIEIRYRDFHSPIVLIVSLHMPVNPNWAHMMSALHQWFIVFLWSMNPYHAQNLRVTPA